MWIRRTNRAWLAVIAGLVFTSCGRAAIGVTDFEMDELPADEEFVKFRVLGEGTLPANAHVHLGTVVTFGPVDAEEVGDVIVERGRRIGHCYAGTLNARPGTVGDMLIRAEIGFEGLMERVEVVFNSTGDRSLERCILNFLEGTRFEVSERRPVTDVRLPLRFTLERNVFGSGQ